MSSSFLLPWLRLCLAAICVATMLTFTAVIAQTASSPEVVPARATQAKPLLVGNWADPTVVKDGQDYYLTHSSFEFQPGLLIWHSKDLRNWRPICHAVTNQPGSIWAPDLIKHNGRYYLYYPASGGNFVVSAASPQGPWSEPRSLGVGHIDPGHVTGPDGTRYLHLSGGNAVELSPDGLQAATKPAPTYAGWPIPDDWATECFCLESPKLTLRDGWYYLTSAQGGTAGPATSHMVVSARSRQPLGPWVNSPFNPIIRTWDRDEQWWSKGHGTLVEGPGAHWYCVLHGYMNGYRSLGRCTLIEPIEWTTDGWFKVSGQWPVGWEQAAKGDFPQSDTFDGPQLGLQWQFFRRYDPARFTLLNGALNLKGQGTDPGSSFPLCVMAMHKSYEVEAELEMEGEGSAGLILFFSPDVYLGLSVDKAGEVRRAHKSFDRFGSKDPVTRGERRVAFRIANHKQDVLVYFKNGAGAWQVLNPALEISGAEHNVLGGWHSVRIALFACGAGQARFHSFTYRPL